MFESSIDTDSYTLGECLKRVGNQIFKLLPMREEGEEWIKPLETISLELTGMYNLFPEKQDLFSLICKLEGLIEEGEEGDFMKYRRTIFECCSLVDRLKRDVNEHTSK